MQNLNFAAWFDELDRGHLENAGGKGASLCKMHKAKLPVPNGFIVCAEAFREFMTENCLFNKVLSLVESIDCNDYNSIEQISEEIRNLIVASKMPESIENIVSEYYAAMGEDVPVAVRSSSTAEDLDDASFAGQQETFLYVLGREDVLQKIKECWASLYNGRAIFYRKQKGFDEREVSIAVVVQLMVNSEKSGVMFTANPITNNRNHILIEGAWGLGEGIVSGTVTPDSYGIDKLSHKILEEYVSEKEMMIIRNISLKGIEEAEVPEDKKCERVLKNSELNELTELAVKLEQFFGKSMDVEWAIEKEKLYLLQSRPITTL